MARKIRRIVSILIVITAVLITRLPVPENMAAGGSDAFQMNGSTLVKYTGTASTVSVPDTAKKIGEEAFAGNKGLNVVSTGDNLEEISFSAFAGCENLSKIAVGNSVTTIGDSVFGGCTGLRKAELGSQVRTIGNGVFAGCNSLKSISINDNNPYLIFENGALYNRDKTILYAYLNGNEASTYKMPNTVEKISGYAFWGNENLDTVTLSSSLKEISGYAFANCRNLSAITIPYSVRSIDAKAFENCISLTDTTIPSAVSYIDPTAFDGCGKLNMIAEEGSSADTFFKSFDQSDAAGAEQDAITENGSSLMTENADGSVTVHSGSSSTGGNSANGNQEEESGGTLEAGVDLKDASTDPSNVEYMPQSDPLAEAEDASVLGKTRIVGGQAVIFLNRDNTQLNNGTVDTGNGKNENSASDHGTDQTIYDEQKGGYLPKYAVLDQKIAKQAFYGDASLTSYTIPAAMQAIGDFAFARSGLTSIQIPSGVTSVGYGAFYYCDALSQIVIPSTVETIEANAFTGTPWLNQFLSGQGENDFLVTGDHILLAYRGKNAEAVIPDGVKKIAPSCFRGHTELQTVRIPDSVTEISEDAFRECSSLTSMQGGKGITKIADRAFLGCPMLSVHIPASVQNIGLRAFDFQKTKDNAAKTVVFEGSKLPQITYGKTSQRLLNEEYRENAFYNVLFAVVKDDCTEFEHTVLQNDSLGFEGMILSVEKDASGNETGNVLVKDSYIFSKETLNSIPDHVLIDGQSYTIQDYDNIQLAEEKSSKAPDKDVTVTYNGTPAEDMTAAFSENEITGSLQIEDTSKEVIGSLYAELFGADKIPEMSAYRLTLWDATETVPITRFGRAVLSVTMPIPEQINGSSYHVICTDEDGQLEEVPSSVDAKQRQITFKTSHLSEFAIYASGDNIVSLSLKDGKLVRNYRLDESPDTGDNSIPVKYPTALLLICIALILFFYKGRRKLSQPV